MNLGELEDGASAEDKNKEEENAEEVKATLVVCPLTLDRADYKDNADNTRLNMTFSCDNEERDLR